MIHDKLLLIQQELKAPKNQFNSFGGYKYRSCEDILEAVKPLLKKQGLTLMLSDEMVEVGGRVYVKATATLTDGTENVQTTAFAREENEKKGFDSSQISGSCSSYARKYCLSGLLLLDDSKDSDYTNTAPKEPAQPRKEPAEAPKPPKDMKYTCTKCGKEITRAEAKYSYDKLGAILCRECQKAR